jgi:hypothetical protein
VSESELHIDHERYGIANRNLLEVAQRLLTNLKNGHTTIELSTNLIDELISLSRLVSDTGSANNDKLRKSIFYEVVDFAEQNLPDYS